MSLEEIQKQFSSCSHNSAGATIKITSKEEMSLTGQFSFNLTIKATDTIYLDSFTFFDTPLLPSVHADVPSVCR